MKTKVILSVLSLLLCTGAFLAFAWNHPRPAPPPTAANTSFNESNYTVMPADTLIFQMKQAYGDSLIIRKEAKQIILTWHPESNNPTAFYNNNEALAKVKRHGFSIQTDGGTLHADFELQQDKLVHVPNDVVLSMVRQLTKRKG